MPIYETFAKRKQKAENAGKPMIYCYDYLPKAFRVQVAHILGDAIGNPQDDVSHERRRILDQWWAVVHNILAREMGVFRLVESIDPAILGYMRPCLQFVLDHQQVDDVLSLIELACRLIEAEVGESQNDAIAELNCRFREHSIGYQYQKGQIIQVDSQYLHAEAVEPAISLLHDGNFAGALQEFTDAHRHYREQKYKEAITASGNAFESAMKTICDKRGWDYNPKRATASALIGILFDNDLVPSELKNHFASLRAALENGLPTVRNQAGQGAHGQGATPVDVPDYLAAYCLHLAASNIVFLIEAHNAKD